MNDYDYKWKWQLRNAIRTKGQLQTVMQLTPEEILGLEHLQLNGGLPLMLTPHILSCMDTRDEKDPIRQQLIPRAFEWQKNELERRDPLGEEDHETVPHLIHRYPDRVLFLVTDRCASYCRYCHRKRWVGQGPSPQKSEQEQALAYIQSHPEIQEVILSGGDPLVLPDERLGVLLRAIRAIEHVEVIRIHTRMLTFAPMRVTPVLLDVLQEVQPVYLVTQINHANELNDATKEAIDQLIKAGVVMLNQSVLLKGVNHTQESMTTLLKKLVRLRIRPYYLHQCDVMEGVSSFRVPLYETLALMKSLRGHISGLCIPQLMIDIPGGFGKVPLVPDPIIERYNDRILLEGFANEQAFYPLD